MIESTSCDSAQKTCENARKALMLVIKKELEIVRTNFTSSASPT